MKAIPLVKLLLMIALVAWMQVLAAPARASAEVLASSPTPEMATATTMGVPETSSVVLIGALGIMLMLRRRRLHA